MLLLQAQQIFANRKFTNFSSFVSTFEFEIKIPLMVYAYCSLLKFWAQILMLSYSIRIIVYFIDCKKLSLFETR